MTYWSWWLSGAALAGVALVHWLGTQRMLGVSGGISSIVNRFRFGPTARAGMAHDDLVEAMRQATAEAFGSAAVLEVRSAAGTSAHASARQRELRAPREVSTQALLLCGLVGGGLLSAVLAGRFEPAFGLTGELFRHVTGDGRLNGAALLVAGGTMVGFGTRMAGGCTSGHGLCGVSRTQPGSIVATVSFFGAGVIVSIVLRSLA